jgi:Dyp-type peroxidase family
MAPSSASPNTMNDFRSITAPDGQVVPATQHDIWLWISASAPDVCWEHARSATRALRDVAELAAEQQVFVYRDNRDMTGFLDGTANPPLLQAADVALVSSGQPGEGGATSSRCAGRTTYRPSTACRSSSRNRCSGGRSERAPRSPKGRAPSPLTSRGSQSRSTERSSRSIGEAFHSGPCRSTVCISSLSARPFTVSSHARQDVRQNRGWPARQAH